MNIKQSPCNRQPGIDVVWKVRVRQAAAARDAEFNWQLVDPIAITPS